MARFIRERVFIVGVVLSLSPLSVVGQTATESTIYTFLGVDGNIPAYLIQASDGNFYGVATVGGLGAECAYFGDDTGCGTIFKMLPSGLVEVLYNFQGSDGSYPDSLVQGSDGNLYGTTAFGGSGGRRFVCDTDPTSNADIVYGCGTIFKITTAGSFSSIYSFTGGNDGANPSGLIQGADGMFYGTTVLGGAFASGVFFEMPPAGVPNPLYGFTGGSDGASPSALVQGSDGMFYGTTQAYGAGYGTVFKVTSAGALTTLYSFLGGSDGAEFAPSVSRDIAIPRHGHIIQQGLSLPSTLVVPNALAEGGDGNFYGITFGYGSGSGSVSPTIFKVTPTGQLNTLYTFTGAAGQAGPLVGLSLGSDGNMYGTSGDTLIQMSLTGSTSLLYTFPGGATGGNPGLLNFGDDGAIYGAAQSGGIGPCPDGGCGTLFKINMTPALQPPVNLSLSSPSVNPGTPVNLSWTVANGFSDTLQQCFAFVQGSATSAGAWTGPQPGTLINGAYNGSLSITPTEAGSYTYALTCGGVESGFATLQVLAPTFGTTPLPQGFQGVPYNTALPVSGGELPYIYTLATTGGSLPPGLSLDSNTGIISGTPTQVGTSKFEIAVADSEPSPMEATANLSIAVVAAVLSANPLTLNISSPGASASTTLTLSGFSSTSISLACSGLPSEAACTFGSPTSANGVETVALTITTTPPTSSMMKLPFQRVRGQLLVAIALPGTFGMVALAGSRRRSGGMTLLAICFLFLAISVTGCGGGGVTHSGPSNPGTPTGQSAVIITGTTSTQSASLSLVVNVQ
jgi:uncharacterized repeat protein (TIGR03803 family)